MTVTLAVDFIGEQHGLEPGEELTFGRAGDIVIDENRYLHRLLGKFESRDGRWWLTNLGSSTALTVTDTSSPSFAKLAPGTAMPIPFERAVVSFEAGGCPYELHVDVLGGLPPIGVAADTAPDGDVEATRTAASLPLSDEQRVLLLALAEPQLRDPGRDDELPTNRDVAVALGWTITKYNRKLDGLCRKYAQAGVSGILGNEGSRARDRRARLVEHAIQAGIITAGELPLLEAARRG